MMLRQNFNRRHSPNRRKTRVEAVMDAEGARLAVEIVDVSYDGMKLAVPDPILPGTPVTIETMGARTPAVSPAFACWTAWTGRFWSRLRPPTTISPSSGNPGNCPEAPAGPPLFCQTA